MSRLPRQVRFPGETYTVRMVEGPIRYNGRDCDGLITYAAREIEIWRDCDDPEETLWHEVVHAILHRAGYKPPHGEPRVDALASGILAVLRANPKMREL